MQATEMLRSAARAHRDRVATVCAGRSRTWGEVEDRVARAAPYWSGRDTRV